jgi:Holliday junction resolvasome RuvABC endonuclease subunit
MRIMALDIATVTGFAIGEAGRIPQSGSVRLKRPAEGADVAAFNMLAFLRDRFVLDAPDLVVIEDFLNPVAHKSADAVILQLQCFGVAVAVCRSYGLRFETPKPETIRKHFAGRGRAGTRQETKAMVLNRAKALGYVPRDCRDDNRADACAAFDYASAHYARVQPKSLVLFGETA